MVSFDFSVSSRAVDDGNDDATDTESTASTLSSLATDEDDPCLLIYQSLQKLEISEQDRFKFVKDFGVSSHRIVSALRNRLAISDHLTELEQCITELAATVFLEYNGTSKPRGYFAANIDRRLQHEILGEFQDLEVFLEGIVDKETLSLTDKERLGIFRQSFRSSYDQIKIWADLSDEHSYPVASAILGQTKVLKPFASTKSIATSPSPHRTLTTQIEEVDQIQEDAKLASLIDTQEWDEWAAEAKMEAAGTSPKRSKRNDPKRRKMRNHHSETTFLSGDNGYHHYYYGTTSASAQSSWYPSGYPPPGFVPHSYYMGPLSFHTTMHTGSRSNVSSSHTINYSVDSNNISYTNIRNGFNIP